MSHRVQIFLACTQHHNYYVNDHFNAVQVLKLSSAAVISLTRLKMKVTYQLSMKMLSPRLYFQQSVMFNHSLVLILLDQLVMLFLGRQPTSISLRMIPLIFTLKLFTLKTNIPAHLSLQNLTMTVPNL